MDKAQLFTLHIPLARRSAWKASRKYGKPFEEMEDEAVSALAVIVTEWDLDTINSYDPKKDAQKNPTGWIHWRIYFALETKYRASKKRVRYMDFTEGTDDVPTCGINPQQPQKWIDRVMSDLGEDARIIVSTILHGPAEVMEDMMPRRRLRGRETIVRHLLDNGWDKDRIITAWHEIEAAL